MPKMHRRHEAFQIGHCELIVEYDIKISPIVPATRYEPAYGGEVEDVVCVYILEENTPVWDPKRKCIVNKQVSSKILTQQDIPTWMREILTSQAYIDEYLDINSSDFEESSEREYEYEFEDPDVDHSSCGAD